MIAELAMTVVGGAIGGGIAMGLYRLVVGRWSWE